MGKQYQDKMENICKVGDFVYDARGNRYQISGERFMQPHSLFERYVSVGTAGVKIRLSYLAPRGNYADCIYVSEEELRNEFCLKPFTRKGIRRAAKDDKIRKKWQGELR